MPVYNRRCLECDWDTDFALEPVTNPRPQCPKCLGFQTERYLAGHGPMVIPDTFSTPVLDSVMSTKKQIHYSRSERKQRMRHHRLQEFQRWTSGNESDKSAIHGARWDAVSADQLRKMEDYMRARYPDVPIDKPVEPK